MENTTYIALDLEATCEGVISQREITEIGAVKINAFGEITGEYQSLVKPKEAKLSKFCIEFTGIQPEELESSRVFEEVYEEFAQWAQEKETDQVCFLSWGNYDKQQMRIDCSRFDLNSLITDANHVNLKEIYAKHLGINKKKKGLGKASEREEIPFEGSHHRALSDAQVVAKIFVKYFDQLRLK